MMKVMRIMMLACLCVVWSAGNPGYGDGGCEGEYVKLSQAESAYAAAMVKKIKGLLPVLNGYYPSWQESPAEEYFLDCDKKKYVKQTEVRSSYSTQINPESMGSIEECSKIMEKAGPSDAEQLRAAMEFQECMKGSGVGTGSVKVLVNQGGISGGSGDQGVIDLTVFKRVSVAGAEHAFQDANGAIYICLGSWVKKDQPDFTNPSLVAYIPAGKINVVANMIIIVEASNDKIRQEIMRQLKIAPLKAMITR